MLIIDWLLVNQDDVDAAGPYHGKSRSEIERVKGILKDGWEGLSVEGINNCCLSFRGKLELVLANGGQNNFDG